MPFENEHSARLLDPDMDKIRVRRTHGSGDGTVQGIKIPKSIDVVWFIVESDGEEVPRAQSLRFPVDDWTEKRARDWVKDNDIKIMLFEAADGKSIPIGEIKVMEYDEMIAECKGKAAVPVHLEEGETQPEFLGRCMLEEKMVEKFPDREERSVKCHGVWRKESEKTAIPARAKAKETEGFVKGVRIERTFLDAKLMVGKEGGDGDAGWIEGYANAFNNLDWYREIVRPGAWKQSIKERVPAGKIKLMVRHFAFGGDSTDLIGTITEGKEDDFGLWYHAELSSVKLAQDSRTLVTEGHLNFNSVGFMPLEYKEIAEWDDGLPATELLKAIWLETTLTNVPANDQSIITAAKKILAQADATLEGRSVLSAEDLGKAEKLLAQLSSLSEGVEKLISLNNPQPEADLLGLQLDVENRRRRLELMKASV